MNKTRSEECFEEIAKKLENEYMMNSRINSRDETDKQKEQYLYLLKDLASFLKLSWEGMNVEHRASQLSAYPPYVSNEQLTTHLADCFGWSDEKRANYLATLNGVTL